ncbi:MAG: NAD(P)H-hydrate dehydratase [Urechidicola sp.]|nr:NAD(P)H-hydrate dehydratase [Urechidicola sp.]
MKILTSKQIGQADQETIKKEGITSLDLMEQAATKCFDLIHKQYEKLKPSIKVFCGVGNNGGDGLVITRLLIESGYDVDCFVVSFSDNRSPNFISNFERLRSIDISIKTISSKSDFPIIENDDLVIDAIFGIGLSRRVEGFTSELIKHINSAKPNILSIDIPSGLFAEKESSQNEAVINATHTYTFQSPKLAFFLPNNARFTKTWEVVDIGLDKDHIYSINSNYLMVELIFVKSIYKHRNKFTHKGSYGHSLIIGGSYGKIGAISLATKAALKSGSGLVTAYIPKCGYEVVQIATPEAMVEVDAENQLEYFNYKSNPLVIGIGPGMGTSEKTINGFSKFLKKNKLPLVLDADALNIISKKKELLNLLPKDTILTPHPKEFERLVGIWKNDYEKLELLKSFSSKYKLIVVLKGAHTIIANGNDLFFNSTGNSGLASGGSGDVLLGIITGLLAQKYSPLNASILGVYLHGLTADLYSDSMSMESFTASDIIDKLGTAFLEIY